MKRSASPLPVCPMLALFAVWAGCSAQGTGEGGRADGGAPPAEDGGLGVPAPWPNATTVTTVDEQDAFGRNVSGLVFQPGSERSAARLWALRNEPSTLFQLEERGGVWVAVEGSGWDEGKALRYPSGSGSPDAEGLARASFTSSRMYVVAEQDNDAPGVSRQSVLLFDTSGNGTSLSAAREWDLTDDLAAAPANTGLEAIAFLPDDFLTARGFVDESRGAPYDPSTEPEHGGGVVVVGAEATGTLYAYVLDHRSSAFRRIARFDSGNDGAMDLWFDRDTGVLWSLCDDGCGGRTAALTIGDAGRFVVRALYERPSALPNLNDEGFTMEPTSACVDGVRRVFWSDDSADAGHALRAGTILCAAPPD